MKAILLVDIGSPSSEKEMKIFLRRMFKDKSALNTIYPVRFVLSWLISNFRYKSSWQKYCKIGGSPLLFAMNKIRDDLSNSICNEYLIHCAYCYSEPLLSKEIERLFQTGIRDIAILSMYPHASIFTTGSIKNIISKSLHNHKDLSIRLIDDYYNTPAFISFWTSLISEKLEELNYENPHLLFSAHAIPKYHINKGDIYIKSIEQTAKLISDKLSIEYSISYQSKIGRMKWSKPETMAHLKELYLKGYNQILIIPISFINENLETMYDIDLLILPYAKNVLGITKIDRVCLPQSHPNLIKTFIELIGLKK